MAEPVVQLDVDRRGVATATLNRPRVNNAYDGALIDALSEGVAECARRDDVRVLVLRGNGRHFQAGADLRWLESVRAEDAEANVEVSRRTAAALRGLNELPKPTVALVHGGCFGGGVGLIASCDVVIASEDALFSITEARWGLHAGIIVPQLNAAMGLRNVRRYALTCERFGAREAMALGLVHEVCATGGLDEAGARVVENLLRCPPSALAETKRIALEEAGALFDDARFDRLVRGHAARRLCDEAGEGLASFHEKREPAWYPAPD